MFVNEFAKTYLSNIKQKQNGGSGKPTKRVYDKPPSKKPTSRVMTIEANPALRKLPNATPAEQQKIKTLTGLVIKKTVQNRQQYPPGTFIKLDDNGEFWTINSSDNNAVAKLIKQMEDEIISKEKYLEGHMAGHPLGEQIIGNMIKMMISENNKEDLDAFHLLRLPIYDKTDNVWHIYAKDKAGIDAGIDMLKDTENRAELLYEKRAKTPIYSFAVFYDRPNPPKQSIEPEIIEYQIMVPDVEAAPVEDWETLSEETHVVPMKSVTKTKTIKKTTKKVKPFLNKLLQSFSNENDARDFADKYAQKNILYPDDRVYVKFVTGALPSTGKPKYNIEDIIYEISNKPEVISPELVYDIPADIIEKLAEETDIDILDIMDDIEIRPKTKKTTKKQTKKTITKKQPKKR